MEKLVVLIQVVAEAVALDVESVEPVAQEF
jgi:hypothetical protein